MPNIFRGGVKMSEIINLFNQLSDSLSKGLLPMQSVPVRDIGNILQIVCKDGEWVQAKMQMLTHLIEREDYNGGALFFRELSCITRLWSLRDAVEYASHVFRDKILERYVDSCCFKGKGVIYTVLTGNYEKLHDPEFVDPRFDYICFTDDDSLRSEVWSIHKLTDTEGLGAQRLSRKPKILADAYLSDYDYSIYIDCKFKIRGDLYKYINKYSIGAPMLCFPHPGRACIYEEAKACIALKKDNPDAVRGQIERYRESGMPEHYGLIEAGCMVRRHGDPSVIRVMDDWWNEFLDGCRRDQISFPYACWKNNFRYDISDLSVVDNEYIGLMRADT